MISESPTRPGPVTFVAGMKVWAYIGLNSFGGPAGQIAVMHRELVDRRRWLSERRFLHALNYCMVLPGPEAQQLATYVGWLMHGVPGGVAAGWLFVIPGFVAMLALSIAYAVWGELPLVAGLLLGLQAAVIAIVVDAVIRIGRRTLRGPLLVAIAGLSFAAIFFLDVPFPIVIAVAGLVGWAVGRRMPDWLPEARHAAMNGVDGAPVLLPDDERVTPRQARQALTAAGVCLVLWIAPVAVLVAVLGTTSIFTQEALMFSKTAVLTFGGAYAVLGYVAQQAVDHYGWIGAKDMVTGLGLAETTPGPLIMVVQFVGFLAAYNNPGALPPLVAGVLGSIVTVWVTFVPCFFFIFLGAPWVERLRDNEALRHTLTAVGAAVAGVVLNLAAWFAINTIFGQVDTFTAGRVSVPVPQFDSVHWPTVAIAIIAAVLVFRLRLGTLKVIAASGALGVAAAMAGLV